MSDNLACDICIIGAGSAGLSVASGAAQLGTRVVLFERGEMGGDCLNYGCVPSKALLAAAHRAQNVRTAGYFGVHAPEPEIDFSAVMHHVRNVIAAIAPHDSVERFESLGVRVIRAAARFTGRREVSGGGVRVTARRIVIAAGSAAALPPIPGLTEVGALTNETIFSLTQRPDHLLIIGGGPIGMEMAQAFRRLGSAVTILEGTQLLQKDEPELVDTLRRQLQAEGVTIREGIKIGSVARISGGVSVTLGEAGEQIEGSHLLVAAGRKPRLNGLDLDCAGVTYTPKGITVDAGLRTSNRHIYAIGDVNGGPQFTHSAGYQAGLVIRSGLFRLPAKVDYRALPWVTYCDPELAHVGLTEAEARRRFGPDVRIATADFTANDRAQAERQTSGGIKLILRRNGAILGVSILGSQAGELISLWSLAMSKKLKLSAVTRTILPYPTRGEISKAAASAFYSPKLFSSWPRQIVRLLLKLG
jgi:pyruvate/2-oxoglutarate dehydrogenase complex dihydrolipoamide dehydrogenase (E3) component